MFSPSQYQQDIFNAALNTKDNLLIEARPGSGKTTTLIEISNRLKSTTRIIFIAFSTQVVKYLKTKVDVDCRTINGLGALTIKTKKNGYLEEDRYKRLISYLIKDRSDINKYSINSLLKLASLCQYDLAMNREEVIKCITHFSADTRRYLKDEVAADLIIKLFDLSIKDFNKTGSHSFSDQIWLPHILNLSPPKYDLLLADEAQDFNRAQLSLILKTANRFICVGDTYQCQPENTLITLSDSSNIPIKEIKKGDKIMSFSATNNYIIKSGLVDKTSSREYEGILYQIKTLNGLSTRCTPNHKWLVRLNNKKGYIVYLMSDVKGRYRIGTTQLGKGYDPSIRSKFISYLGKPSGLVNRIISNKANKAWILSFHLTKEEALAYETIISCKYSIPQTVFVDSDKERQAYIDLIFDKTADKSEYRIRALKCLREHGREIDYPFISKTRLTAIYDPPVFQIEACNLIPEIMYIPIPSSLNISSKDSKFNRAIEWVFFYLSKELYRGKVYSLSVDRYKTYIADGIITHNSIMGFSGSDCDSMLHIKQKTNAVTYPLPICYRCPTSHLDLARKLVPDIENGNTQTGQIETISLDRMIEIVKEEDVIICRNNAPLVSTAIKLMKEGKKARVLGQDLASILLQITSKLDFSKFEESAFSWKLKQISMLSKVSDMFRIDIEDKYKAIIYCWEAVNKTTDRLVFDNYVNTLFSKKGKSILMSSIHKIKGMEHKTVFVLNAHTMPVKWKNQKKWELQQELNLKLVALTRSTDQMYLVNM